MNQNVALQSNTAPNSGSKLGSSSSKKQIRALDITDEEKNLIALYFRHRFITFFRITEEKIKMNLMLYRQQNSSKRNEAKTNSNDMTPTPMEVITSIM